MKNIAKLGLLSLVMALVTIPRMSSVEVGAEAIEEDTTVIGLKDASGNLGFELSNSDYAGANFGNNFDGLQTSTNYINAFQKVKMYSLNKNSFQRNNPNGGSTYSSIGTSLFPNMWAPQEWLEQDNNGTWRQTRPFVTGDIVYIPKGTTFPSYTYLMNQSGTVKKYKSSEDASFIYTESKQFVPCDFSITTIEELKYYENVNSKNYVGIKLKDSDYCDASTNKTLNTSKIDQFTFRKGVDVQGKGLILTDTMIGGEHDYHYGVIINKDNDATLAIEADNFEENDQIRFKEFITFPSYSYLSGAISKPTGYVIEYTNIFKKTVTGFEKTSTEPYYFEDEMPLVDSISGVSAYTNSTTIYSAEEAKEKGIPDGYEGTVSPVSGNNGGYTLGYGSLEKKISIKSVLSIKFRFYMESKSDDNDSYPEIRITKDAGASWIVRLPRTKLSPLTDNWVDFELVPEGNSYCSASEFAKFADNEGFLISFFFGYRSNSFRNFYLDSVKVLLAAPDKEAPVITYGGPNELTTRVGRTFIVDASAYDLYEDREIPLVYEWYEGETRLTSIPSKEGTYRLKLVATDNSGNSSIIELTVIFLEPDTVAPVLSLKVSTMHASAGEKIYFNVTAVDDVDGVVPVKVSYPNNMLDALGYLKKGTFSVVFEAKDLSDNVTQKTLALIVL